MESWTKEAPPNVVVAPIDEWGEWGLWIRRRCLPLITASTPVLLYLQSKRTANATTVMKCFSFLGLEDFFTPLIMAFIWLIDAKFGRLFLVLLSIGFFLAGCIKSLLCLPRPEAPPVQPAVFEDKDWAVPSNHSVIGLLMPWYIWSYLYSQELPFLLLLPTFYVLLTWTIGVNFSRLYLGVHGLFDVFCGIALGVCVLVVFDVFDEAAYDYYLTLRAPGALMLVMGTALAFYYHPRTWPETQSHGESVIVVSCALGAIAGRAFSPTTLPMDAVLGMYPDSSLLYNVVVRGTCRFLLGGVLVMGFRAVVKPLMTMLAFRLCSAFALPAYSYSAATKKGTNDRLAMHYHPRRYAIPTAELVANSEWMEWSERPVNIDIGVRMVVYSGMGFIASELAPALFARLKL